MIAMAQPTITSSSDVRASALSAAPLLFPVAACVLVLLGTQNALGPIAGVAVVNGVAFAVARHRIRPFFLAPPVILSVYLTVIALGGYFFANALVGSGGTGGVDVALAQDELRDGATYMLGGSSIILLAASAVSGRAQSTQIQLRGSLVGVARFTAPLLLIGTVHVLYLVQTLGLGALLERPDRLVGRANSFEAVSQMLAVGMVLALGIIFFSGKGAARGYAAVLIATYGMYFFSLGSRRLALIPILLLIAQLFSRGGRLRPGFVAAVVVLSPALLALPLYLRGLATHGLVPYLGSLPAFALDGDNYLTSVNNILAGFKITVLTGLSSPQIPLENLWISINPLTGNMAGWYDVAPTMRLNRFTPYSAVGELINYGPVVFILFFAALGVLLSMVHRLNLELLKGKRTIFVGLAVLGLTVVLTVQFGQYNLRSNIRYLYLMIGIQLVTLWLTSSSRKAAAAEAAAEDGNSRSG